MNRTRDLIQIEEAYSAVNGNPPGVKAAKQQLNPGKPKSKTWAAANPKAVKDIPVGNDKSTKGFVHNNSGPAGADNFISTELDPTNPAIKDDNLYNVKQLSDEEADTYFREENKKIKKESINTNMAKNKSGFDRLYEEVMDDEQLDAVELGIGDVEDDAGGDEIGDEVTFTLSKDVAQQLHTALMDVLEDDEAGDEDLGDEDLGGDDVGGDEGFDEMEEEDESSCARKRYEDEEEDEEDEENFNYFGEEIEFEDLGHPLVNQKKGSATPPTGKSNVPSTQYTSSVGSKGGDPKVTDKVGNDGDEGHPLVNQKKGKPTPVKGGANKVPGVVKGGGKGDQPFFQKNS